LKKLFKKSVQALAVAALVAVAGTSASASFITGLYNTGVNADGTIRGHDAPELHYTVAVTPIAPNTVGGSTDLRVISSGFPASSPYVDPGPNARWISPFNGSPGGTDPNPADYAFSLNFNVTANVADIRIAGFWNTDNAGTSIKLNGTEISAFGATNYTTSNTQFLTDFKAFAFVANSGQFNVGSNTLTFTVRNAGPQPSGNPVALAVQFANVSAGAVIPEPAAISLFGFGALLLGTSRLRRKQS
jgi:hypothetical protein